MPYDTFATPMETRWIHYTSWDKEFADGHHFAYHEIDSK